MIVYELIAEYFIVYIFWILAIINRNYILNIIAGLITMLFTVNVKNESIFYYSLNKTTETINNNVTTTNYYYVQKTFNFSDTHIIILLSITAFFFLRAISLIMVNKRRE